MPTQGALIIQASVSNENDHDLRFPDLERDRHAPLEAHDAKSWSNVIAAGPSLGRYLKGEAGFFDARDEGGRVFD